MQCYYIYVPGGTFTPPLEESMADRLPEDYAKTVTYPWFRAILIKANKDRCWSWSEICPDAIIGFTPKGSAQMGHPGREVNKRGDNRDSTRSYLVTRSLQGHTRENAACGHANLLVSEAYSSFLGYYLSSLQPLGIGIRARGVNLALQIRELAKGLALLQAIPLVSRNPRNGIHNGVLAD